MAETLTRADMRPGQVVEYRIRYVVRPTHYPAQLHDPEHPRAVRNGAPKLNPVPNASRFVMVRDRWRVWRCPMATDMWREDGPVLVRPGQWIAHTIAGDPDGYKVPFKVLFEVFDTHAEAIAYADKESRRG